MLDLDPALEAAAHTPLWVQLSVMSDPAVLALIRYPGNGVCYIDGHPHDVAEAILHAAFRSLGCATPEAVAALRELVRTALAFEGLARETDKEKDSQEVIGTIARGRYSQGAMIAAEALRRFARLATPPEEGR